MWVKSMQSYVITYQRSGDAGFPHKKYKVKKKLGQGATAKGEAPPAFPGRPPALDCAPHGTSRGD